MVKNCSFVTQKKKKGWKPYEQQVYSAGPSNITIEDGPNITILYCEAHGVNIEDDFSKNRPLYPVPYSTFSCSEFNF